MIHDYIQRDEEGNPSGTIRAIDDVSLDVSPGQFIAILGHNGSGKSTLAKLFNGILVPTEGKIFVKGMDTSDDDLLFELRKTVGMVFQNPDNQLVATIVEEDVAFAPENLGVEPAEIAKYAESIGVLGIGLYDTFVHIDTRPYKSFWYGHQQEYRDTFGGGTYTLELPVLKYGDRGELVRALQILLKGRGFSVGATGNFGYGTESVVKKFQKANGLPADGICDKKTMEALLGKG